MNKESGKITSFTKLETWQEAHRLVLEAYALSKLFPREEMFGLANQMRRASVSITSNIAEGFSRQSYKEKAQFYSVALGSLTEVQSQLLIARDLGYIQISEFDEIASQTIKVHKMLNGLIKSSKNHDS
ncbi:MAG: four helix bundle protein [Candidatus Moraniibacteriota bacterium]